MNNVPATLAAAIVLLVVIAVGAVLAWQMIQKRWGTGPGQGHQKVECVVCGITTELGQCTRDLGLWLRYRCPGQDPQNPSKGCPGVFDADTGESSNTLEQCYVTRPRHHPLTVLSASRPVAIASESAAPAA